MPESCPEEIRQVIRSCWAQLPSKRPRFEDVSPLAPLPFLPAVAHRLILRCACCRASASRGRSAARRSLDTSYCSLGALWRRPGRG